MRTRDHVLADDFLAHLRGSCGTGVDGGLDRAHIAAHQYGHQSGSDLHVAEQGDIGRLDHRIRSLDGPDVTPGLNET